MDSRILKKKKKIIPILITVFQSFLVYQQLYQFIHFSKYCLFEIYIVFVLKNRQKKVNMTYVFISYYLDIMVIIIHDAVRQFWKVLFFLKYISLDIGCKNLENIFKKLKTLFFPQVDKFYSWLMDKKYFLRQIQIHQ